MNWFVSQRELFFLLVVSTACGFAGAVFYDLFRLRRICFALKSAVAENFLIAVEDVIFFASAGITLTLVFFVLNSGQVRLMGVGGFLSGFLLWRFTISKYFLIAAGFVLKLLALPIKKALMLVKKFVGRIMSAWKYKKEAARTAGICRRALEDASHGFVKK